MSGCSVDLLQARIAVEDKKLAIVLRPAVAFTAASEDARVRAKIQTAPYDVDVLVVFLTLQFSNVE
jgi:hypothetical protein